MTCHGHRTITHSIVFFCGLAVVLLPVHFFFPVMYKALLFAYVSHIFIDCFNLSGIRLFYPFSQKEYISFKTETLRVKVSSWKEFTVFLVLLVSIIFVSGRSVSISGAAFSVTRLIFKSYSVGYSSFRDLSGYQCKAEITWFDPLLHNKKTLSAPILSMSPKSIVVKEGRERLVLNSADVIRIKIINTGNKLLINSFDSIKDVPFEEDIFVSGTIVYNNYIPDVKSNDFISTTAMPSSMKIVVSSITRAECVQLLGVGSKVEEEKEKLKRKLPGYQLQRLEKREAGIEGRIAVLSRKGLYDNYVEINSLTKQLKSVQSQKERLLYQMDEGDTSAVQARLAMLEDFSIEADLYWFRVE